MAMNQDLIIKSLTGNSVACCKMRKLLAEMIACGDVEVIRRSDKLQRQGLMNKLMREVDLQDANSSKINY